MKITTTTITTSATKIIEKWCKNTVWKWIWMRLCTDTSAGRHQIYDQSANEKYVYLQSSIAQSLLFSPTTSSGNRSIHFSSFIVICTNTCMWFWLVLVIDAAVDDDDGHEIIYVLQDQEYWNWTNELSTNERICFQHLLFLFAIGKNHKAILSRSRAFLLHSIQYMCWPVLGACILTYSNTILIHTVKYAILFLPLFFYS